MKKTLLTLAIVIVCYSCYAQSQITTTGNNLINTSNPYAADIVIGSDAGTRHDASMMWWSNSSASRISNTSDVFYLSVWNTTNPNIALAAGVGGTSYFQGNLGIGLTNPTRSLSLQNSSTNTYMSFNNSGTEKWVVGDEGTVGDRFIIYGGASPNYRLAILNNGNIGIGTTSPQSIFHINDGGSSSNVTGEYTGDLIIQGNTGNRTSTTGASLEFVTPANTDGSNPWGQARIIGVAGNANNGDATGKLILGTRRWFDKGVGTGATWNYGDDLVIDGGGNIGVNTSNTYGYKFAVNGTVIATSVTVKAYGNWPDYVFKKNYTLPSLTDVKTYIDQNHHLPDMPSEQEVITNGLNLGEMNKVLTKKVEELTLYLIEKDKKEKEQQNQMDLQKDRITKLEIQLQNLIHKKEGK